MSNIRLEYLKKALHPEKQINIIDQCEIVAEALSFTGDYVENIEGLAIYLEVSESKVYQMNYIHHNMTPELKDYFRTTEYQCHTTYDNAKQSIDQQMALAETEGFIKNLTSETTIINKEKE